MAKKAKSNVITTCVFMHMFENEDGTTSKVVTMTVDNRICLVKECDNIKLKFKKEEGKNFFTSQCIDCEVKLLGVTSQRKHPVVALVNAKNHERDTLMEEVHSFAESCEIVEE